MSEFGEQREQEIRCECGFLVGFSATLPAPRIMCVYCMSEIEFFRKTFAKQPAYIYETIPTDKTPWRRGLMFDRKQSIRWAIEDIENE